MIRLKYFSGPRLDGICVLLRGFRKKFSVYSEEEDIMDSRTLTVKLKTQVDKKKVVETLLSHTFKITWDRYIPSSQDIPETLCSEDYLWDLDVLPYSIKVKIHDKALYRRIMREELSKFKKLRRFENRFFIL